MPKLKFLVLSLSLLFCSGAYTQTSASTAVIDSLNQIIDSKVHDTIKVEAYLQIAGQLYLSTPDSALLACQESLGLSKSSNYLRGLSESYGWLAYLENVLGNSDKALEYYQESLPIAVKIGDKAAVAVTLNNIAEILQAQGKVKEALNYRYKSLSIYEELDDKFGIGLNQINMGSNYLGQGDTLMALDFFLKSINNHKESNYKFGLAFAYNNIGVIYDNNHNLEMAIAYYDSSLVIRKEMNDKSGYALLLSNMASVKIKQGEKDEAVAFYLESLKIREEINDPRGISATCAYLADNSYAEGKIQEAKAYGERSLSIAKSLGIPDLIKRVSLTLAKVYAELNQGKETLKMSKLYYKMRDSLNSVETQKATANQAAKYEYEKQKEIDDIQHEQEIALQLKAEEKQEIITYSVLGVCVLSLLFIAFVVNRLRVTKSQKEIIEKQKNDVELQKEIIEETHQEITDSIAYAKRIQSAILPSDKEFHTLLSDAFVLYKPKDVVAGDFYWIEKHGNRTYFAAADCTGHGVPGAMISVICNGALNRAVREYSLLKPSEILEKVREIVIAEFEKSEEDVKDGMDIALCCIEGQILTYAGAHNPLWVLRKDAEEITEIKANKQPIGKFDFMQEFVDHEIELIEGDLIYIFSDGFVDQFGGQKGKKFKSRPFKELLISLREKSMDEMKLSINNEFESWRGELEQVDDICVMALRI